MTSSITCVRAARTCAAAGRWIWCWAGCEGLRPESDPWGGASMTEAEWLACQDPTLMLVWLRGRVSERKARLHGCACCRRRMQPDLDRRGWQAVEAAERYAEGRT